tara:strand:+ start:1245 stop:1517 length:273 start_codon:yes stop_codon:yes gene_type:complete
MGRPSIYTQQTIDAVHQMEENGKTIKQTIKHMKLSRNQVTYLLYKKESSESMKMPYGYENKFPPIEPNELEKGYKNSFEKFLKRFTSWLS